MSQKSSFDLVTLPAGSFLMGGLNNSADCPQGIQHGLAGKTYGWPDFSFFNGFLALESFDEDWGERRGPFWSVKLHGTFKAPTTAEVTFTAEVNEGVRLFLGHQPVIRGWGKEAPREGTFFMREGESYPVELQYFTNSGKAHLKLSWEWDGKARETVPVEHFTMPEAYRGRRPLMDLEPPYCFPYGEYNVLPVREVTLADEVKMSAKPITAEQFREFRPEHPGTGYVTDVSWHDAMAFCKWLSEKEGKPYRLPTEAEWEYAARAGTTTFFGTGDTLPEPGEANAWGLIDMGQQPPEWVLDWYDRYPADKESDPAGPDSGMVKVIRGGPISDGSNAFALKVEESVNLPGINVDAPYFYRAAARHALEPAFPSALPKKQRSARVLAGTKFNNTDLTDPCDGFFLESFDQDMGPGASYTGGDGPRWSARVSGTLTGPIDGEVAFQADVNEGIRIRLDGKEVLDGWSKDGAREFTFTFEKGREYNLEIEMYVDRAPGLVNKPSEFDPVKRVMIHHPHHDGRIKLCWSWEGQERSVIPMSAITEQPVPNRRTPSQIGFRVVQAPMPEASQYRPAEPPFSFQAVKMDCSQAGHTGNTETPYFKRRTLFPIPPDNYPIDLMEAAGFDGFGNHNESPALTALPNGDVLAIYYSAPVRPGEYYPAVRFVAMRLRHGAETWDFPEIIPDKASVVGAAMALWRDENRLWYFMGGVGQKKLPFKYCYSDDFGQTWSPVQPARMTGVVGKYSPQPHPSVFRGQDGKIRVASDGISHDSVLWTSDDEGETWYDPGGRSFARHTPFVELKDGRILGIGGKNSNIDGYQIFALSEDGAASFKPRKSPFPATKGKQRPAGIRLQSGRLFFASDFQMNFWGVQPEAIREKYGLGSYVAISNDEGETWHLKKLPQALKMEVHDQPRHLQEHPFSSDTHHGTALGYTIATQTPNGQIHLISSFNHPCQHFEFNEAWILSGEEVPELPVPEMGELKSFEEKHSNGQLRCRWSGAVASDGRYYLHGPEEHFFEDGQPLYRVEWNMGHKTGEEKFWSQRGHIRWERDFGLPQERTRWTQYWSNGQKKAESLWSGMVADGQAQTWDPEGRTIRDLLFNQGIPESCLAEPAWIPGFPRM